MKILFITDLHGVKWKYQKTLEIANHLEVDIIINGGDMLPGKVSLSRQGKFISDFLDDYFSKINETQRYYLSYLGNDDAISYDDQFQEICDKYDYIKNIAQKKVDIQGCEFIGMSWVPDYPFPLKDRTRMDTKEFKFPHQRGNPILTNGINLKDIQEWFSYANQLPTIEQEMAQLIRPNNFKKSIYIIHTPPSNIGLDICYDARRVGSKAIYEFLLKYQPLMALHGHIHECPEMWGKWFEKIGDTICIQPGQTHNLIYVIINLEKMTYERFNELKRP